MASVEVIFFSSRRSGHTKCTLMSGLQTCAVPFYPPQLALLGGVDAVPTRVHRLFFALLPGEATRGRLVQVADALRASHPDLRARWVNTARYHASPHFLGDHATLRRHVVDAAMADANSSEGRSAGKEGVSAVGSRWSSET